MEKNQALEIANKIFSGASQSIGFDEVVEKLIKNQKLIVKAGFDPTSPDLHIGHSVVINKLKECSLNGCDVVFIIGDFTASIGDPTGKVKTRPQLNEEQIEKNCKQYFEQAQKILKGAPIREIKNSTWFKDMGADGMLKLLAKQTLAGVFARDEFRQRHQSGQAVGLHELVYPLLQGHDSVMCEADIEIGGNDQWLNMLMGRHLQKLDDKSPQAIIALPLIPGIDGFEKMGKSLNNHIPLNGDSFENFSRLMSVSDDVFFKMLPLLPIPMAKRSEELFKNMSNPMDLKLDAAFELVEVISGQDKAISAKDKWIDIFRNKNIIVDAIEITLEINCLLANAIFKANLSSSASEARRLIKQKAVKIDGNKIEDEKFIFTKAGEFYVSVGSRKAAKIIIR